MDTNSLVNKFTGTTEVYKEKKTSKVAGGRTIGNPELSEKAQKYYEDLKKRFSDMEFILVSPDKKAEAEANASRYASPYKTVVLIDSEKIEKMAEDEEYRKKYEGIISGARNQIAQMKESLDTSGANVTSFGIKVNDGGTASFFAVIDKSLVAQKQRIQKKAAERKAEKKEQAKKAQEKRAEEKRAEQKEKSDKPDKVTITASSVDELMKKINDYILEQKSDSIETDEEKMIGQKFDFSI